MFRCTPIAAALLNVGLAWQTALAGADGWRQKPYSEWTLDETNQVLFRSPWVKRQTSLVFLGFSRAVEVSYFVRLYSAKPMRLALARWAQYRPEANVVHMGRFDHDKAQLMLQLTNFPKRIVVAVSSVSEAFLRPLERMHPDRLREGTYLQIDRQRLPLVDYVPPSGSPAGDALFLFARPEKWKEAKQIRFVTHFGQRFRVKLNRSFRLKDLYFGGEVEY